jgi:hypothetical protein
VGFLAGQGLQVKEMLVVRPVLEGQEVVAVVVVRVL